MAHPSVTALEAYAVGDPDPDVAAHVATCEQCQAYVASLDRLKARFLADESAEAFLRRPAIRAALHNQVADETPPRAAGSEVIHDLRSWWRTANRTIGAVAVSAAALFAGWIVLPSSADLPNRDMPYTDPLSGLQGGTEGIQRSDEVRPKGTMPAVRLTVVRKRADRVSRHFGQVSIRPGDALQIELELRKPTTMAVAVVGDDGEFTLLSSSRPWAAGRHEVGGFALEVDDAPTGGWFVAGPPAAVEAARRTGRPGLELFSCRIERERRP